MKSIRKWWRGGDADKKAHILPAGGPMMGPMGRRPPLRAPGLPGAELPGLAGGPGKGLTMKPVEIQSESSEYVGALRPIRIAKTVAWLVVWLALAGQVVCFILAQFTASLGAAPAPAVRVSGSPAASPGQVRPTSGPQAVAEANAAAEAKSAPEASGPPATRPSARARSADDAGQFEAAGLRRAAVAAVLSFTKFAGVLAALAMTMFIAVALLLSIAARLGGAGGFASALVWSILLLLALVPWQQFLGGLVGSGVLVGYDEMQRAIEQVQPDWSAGKYLSAAPVAHLARFLLAPFIALLIWILVGLRFAQGMKGVNRSTSVQAPPKAEPESGQAP